MRLILLIGLLVLGACSTGQIIDVGPLDASVTLGQIDAEATGVPGAGAKVEIDGCTLIFRNIDKLLGDSTPDKLLSSIVMQTPTCKFGDAPEGTIDRAVRRR